MKRLLAAIGLAAGVLTAHPAAAWEPVDGAYDRAVTLRLQGRAAEAEPLLESVLASRPDDVDARLQLALVQIALDRLAEADANLGRVLEQAPDYADARLARARIALAQGRLDEADALVATAGETRESRALKDQIAAARRPPLTSTPPLQPWRLDLAGAASELSDGLPGWKEASATLSRRFGAASAAALTVEWAERFGREDVYVQGRFDRRIGAGFAYVGVGGAPEADFRPEFAVIGGFAAPVLKASGSSTALTLDAGWARFSTGDVTTITPGLEQTLAEGRVVLAARWVNVIDESDDYQSGYVLGATLGVSPRLRLRVGWADAPESSEGFVVRVRGPSAGFEYDVSDRVTIRLDGGHEDRGAYQRTYLGLATAVRF